MGGSLSIGLTRRLSGGGDAALGRSFERARSKFCSLDVDRIINSTRLDDIFKEVDNTKTYL